MHVENLLQCTVIFLEDTENLAEHNHEKTFIVIDLYYLSPESSQYRRLDKAITNSKQIYLFSDYGIQSIKDGISFTLKVNMGI